MLTIEFKFIKMNLGEDGRLLLASGGADAKLGIWSPWNRTCLTMINAHTQSISSVRWLGPGNNFLVTASYDNLIKVWSTRGFTFLKRIVGQNSQIFTLEVLSNGLLAVGSGNLPQLLIIDINTAQSLNTLTLPSGTEINTIKQLPDGRLAIVGNSSMVFFLNLTDFTFVQAELSASPAEYMNGIVVAQDANMLITSWNDSLALFDYRSNRTMQIRNAHHQIACLQHFPKGLRFSS